MSNPFGSVMNMFRGTPTQEQQQQVTQAQQQQQQQAAQQQTNGQPVQAANPAGKEQEVSGLDRFNDLWQTPVKKEGEEGPREFDPSNMFDLNPETLNKSLQNFSIADAVSKEDLQAVFAGGEEAGAALLRILDASTRQTLRTSVLATGKMTESAFSQAIPSLDGKINSQLRNSQIGTQLKEQSPLMKSEAAKPMLTALATQFSAKHPDATPDEVVAMVNDYMVAFGESMGLEKPGANNSGGRGGQGKASETDWSKFWNT